ncbi:MAG: tRNA lysidine(34) synthetase TilS [Candidatus Brocadiia bacterium]|nr:tRNA lysidine(34) synthetase TilS [Candidatus Brocadiia bacterium]
MDSLPEKVSAHIVDKGLLAPGEAVLAGLSGGGDSVALVLILRELAEAGALPLKVHLAHVNHGLRGRESDADEAFCRELAAGWGLELTVKRLPAGHLERQGGSTEDAARRERMAFFMQLARRKGMRTILLAHHADDVAETVVMRLLRGCGVHGLGAMRAERPAGPGWSEGRIVRPLLRVTKDDLRAYLGRKGQCWREDRSNADLRFTRNRVRHRLLPALVAACPGLSRGLLGELNEAACEVGDLLEGAVAARWPALCREHAAGEVALDAGRLRDLPGPLRKAAARRAAGALGGGDGRSPGWSHAHYEQLAAMPDRAVGTQLTLPGGITVSREHGLIRWRRGRQAETIEPRTLPIPGAVRLDDLELTIEAEVLTMPAQGHSALVARAGPRDVYLSPASLEGPVTIRSRRAGDRFHALGAPGGRKLKEFFIDRKVPRLQRDRTPLVLAADGRIAWVVGHEIADGFKLTGREGRVVHLAARPDARDEPS